MFLLQPQNLKTLALEAWPMASSLDPQQLPQLLKSYPWPLGVLFTVRGTKYMTNTDSYELGTQTWP